MAEKKPIHKPFSLQLNEEAFDFNSLPAEEFAPATTEEKENFIQNRPPTSYWKDAWRRMRRNTVAMVALVILALVVLFTFVGPLLVPYTYNQMVAGAENLHPWHYSLEDQIAIDEATVTPEQAVAQAQAEAEAKGETLSNIQIAQIRAKAKGSSDIDAVIAELGVKSHIFGYSRGELERQAAGESVFPHVLGTDSLGRDIMVRVMMGGRISLLVGIFAALLVLLIGATYGSISGYAGGMVDAVMQRIVEVIQSVPEVLVILLIATVLRDPLVAYSSSHTGVLATIMNALGANIIAMFIAFGLLYWVTMSRIIRGQILQLKQQEYVTAARALGARGGRIIKRHLLPNCVGQIVTTTFLQIPSAIFLESFLSFLGVGVSSPMTSWGSMCSDALSGMTTYPYRLFIPAVLLSLTILCLNLVGDGLRDALDPKLKK